MKETGRQLLNNSNINSQSNQNQTSSQKAIQPKTSVPGGSSSHKQEQPGSSGQISLQFQKQSLKIQQMPSATTPSHGQGLLSGVGSGMLAGGSSVGKERGENQHGGSSVQHLLNQYQQKYELPGQGQYTQGTSFRKNSIIGEHEKQIGPAGLPSKESGGLENQAGINQVQVQQQTEMPVSNQLFGRRRSPEVLDFSQLFKRKLPPAIQKTLSNKANLNLIAHPYSEAKRNQNQEARAGKAARFRASQHGHFPGGNVLEQTNSQGANQNIQSKAGPPQQQRPAGKASGMQPSGEGHHPFMDQTSSQWKAADPQPVPSAEKTSVSHSVHGSIFSQVGKTFHRKQFGAGGQHTQYGSRDNILNPLLPGSRSYAKQFSNIDTPVNPQNMVLKQQRNHTIQKEDVPKAISPTNNFTYVAGSTGANSGLNAGSELDASTSANTRGFKAQTMSTAQNNPNTTSNEGDQFKVSGQKLVHEQTAYEFAKPHLIQNKGGQAAGHGQRRTFSRGRKGQAHMMSSGLTVMGLPFQPDTQQAQDGLNTSNVQAPDESVLEARTIEMTPQQAKDISKYRSLNIRESESVGIKVPIQQKAQPILHNTLEQLEEDHRVQAQAKRANSIGKTNKRNSKLVQALKPGQQTTDFQDLFSIHNYKADHIQAMRHQSFQAGVKQRIKPLQKNQLFKLHSSQASSQINDPGSGVTISPKSTVLGGGSIPQSSFPGPQDLKVQLQSSAQNTVEEQMAQSHIMQLQAGAKKSTLQPTGMPHLQAQHKQVQEKIKKTRTEDVPAQRLQMQHSPDGSELAKADQQPVSKIQRTPMSNRKRLVIPMQPPVSPCARAERGKASTVNPQHHAVPTGQAADSVGQEHEADHDAQEKRIRESHKHRNIKQIIKHNKQLQQIHNLNVSSFNSQKKSNEEEMSDSRGDVLDDEGHALEDSSEDDLERDEFAAVPDMGQGLTSGATQTARPVNVRYHLPAQDGSKQEEEEKDEVVLTGQEMSGTEGKQSNMLPQLIQKEIQHRPSVKEVHRAPPIFGKNKEKLCTNLKKDLLDSDNFSKFHHSSSDSSFARTFNRLLEESEGLRWQYKMILRRQLSIDNDVYTSFVDRIISKNKDLLQNYSRSMPLNRKREDFFEQMKPFTFDNVVKHIENEKLRHAQSEQNQREDARLIHSDMSGRFLNESGGQSHASILSPNFSGGNGHSGVRGYRHLHSHKRRLHRYLSVSYGGGIKQAHSANGFALPDLVHRQRNSVCQFGAGFRLGGISDNSLSQRYHRAKESSHSNKTTPTPSQNNYKLQNLQEAANRVNIVSPIQHPLQPPSQPTLAQLYNRRNNNEGNVNKTQAHYNNFQQLASQQNQQIKDSFKQENNFFQQTKDQMQASRIYGKAIEWQQGKLLGSGSTGEVYEAIDINSGEMFVVKKIQLIHPFKGVDQSKAKAVKKEIDRFQHLDYKYIVKYKGREIIENNTFCIYLEYMPGGSIADICREFGRIGESIARTYIHQVLKALNYLHSNNIVHGDLKGANVLCTKDARDTKLCDLGNSLQFENEKSMTSTNSLCNGTLAWMAPEAQFSKIGKKSDVWSLGCLLVEMLTGDNPWGKRLSDTSCPIVALQTALLAKERPEIPKHVTKECQNFIDKCLNHNYKDRPYAHDLLQDPWIKQLGPPSTSS